MLSGSRNTRIDSSGRSARLHWTPQPSSCACQARDLGLILDLQRYVIESDPQLVEGLAVTGFEAPQAEPSAKLVMTQHLHLGADFRVRIPEDDRCT
jgi:hypothetical protein